MCRQVAEYHGADFVPDMIAKAREHNRGIALPALVQGLYGGLYVGVRAGDLDPLAVDVDDLFGILASGVRHANGDSPPAY